MMNLVKANEPWLDVVPDDWKRSRIKNVSLLSPSYSDHPPRNGKLCAVVPMEKVSDNGIVDTSDQIYFEDIQSGLTLFEKGDVLFAKITPCMENGKGAFVESLSTQYAFGSTEFHVLRPSHAVDGKFLYFYTFNSVFRAYAAENMSGAAGQKRVSSRFIKDTRLFLPPLLEQRRIAAYLDKTCAAIDAAIEKKQKQLETLDALRKSIIHKAVTRGLDDSVELKDSGVEWIGKIPKHWEAKRIKRYAQVKRGASPRPIADPIYFDDNGEYAWVRIADVSASGRYLEKTTQMLSELGVSLSVKQYAGDLFISIAGTVGKPIITKIKCCIHDGFIWFDKPTFNKDYIYFIFMSEAPYQGLGKLGTQLNLNTDTIGQIFIPEPPKNEIDSIVTFLNKKTTEIDALKENINAQISTLEQYRKSLIHECVTGKQRITEAYLKEIEAHV